MTSETELNLDTSLALLRERRLAFQRWMCAIGDQSGIFLTHFGVMVIVMMFSCVPLAS